MIVYKRGVKLPPKRLTAVLRAQHEQLQKQQADELERRAKRNIPASDEPPCEKCGKAPEVVPLPDFNEEAHAHLGGLTVVYKSLSLADVRGYRISVLASLTGFTDDEETDPDVIAERVERLQQAERHAADRARDAARKLVSRVDGLANMDGSDLAMPAGDELSADELDLLEDNGLLDPLVRAGMYLQDLPDEARKNCGASQPSTSANSTAAPAPNTSAPAEDVTTWTGPIPSAVMTSTGEPATPPNTQPGSAPKGP